ncbi:MAG: hypothetical protein CM15mP46_6390 [Alphaproteobacteria bacterium]|nr:MAG: hypothetical protein CM15mP46_6390 [Alphaproteobacteria bacterium]
MAGVSIVDIFDLAEKPNFGKWISRHPKTVGKPPTKAPGGGLFCEPKPQPLCENTIVFGLGSTPHLKRNLGTPLAAHFSNWATPLNFEQFKPPRHFSEGAPNPLTQMGPRQKSLALVRLTVPGKKKG